MAARGHTAALELTQRERAHLRQAVSDELRRRNQERQAVREDRLATQRRRRDAKAVTRRMLLAIGDPASHAINDLEEHVARAVAVVLEAKARG